MKPYLRRRVSLGSRSTCAMASPSLNPLKHLARIHDAQRIERAFYSAHQLQLERRLVAKDLLPLRSHPKVIGLAEFMNFPGVLNSEPDVLDKLVAFQDGHIDGHAPLVRGYDLNGYLNRIDYKGEPPVGLADDDRAWMGELLRQQKLR